MKKNFKVFSIGTLVCLSLFQTDAFAQQEPLYSQYMYNTTVFNPAYAGSTGAPSIFGQYRTQWVGLEGSPKTATISAHAPLGDSKVGMGITFVNDQIGAMDQNNIAIDFSYTVDLNQDWKMALGLKGAIDLLSVDYDKLSKLHETDPVFKENIKNRFTPNIGAGTYFYNRNSYIGFSVPSFLQQKRYNGNDDIVMEQKMTFYLMGGHVFNLNENLDLKPAVLLKAVSGSPIQADISANFLFYKKVTAGLAYRTSSSIAALAGFQVRDGLFIGYSYDATTTKLAQYNSGSHEIFLKFDLVKKLKIFNSPRFF
ncbi:MAG: type IX secretion system membrane protein PorP/SprF [Flavobacteriaceae bacterium]|jgi:type IX secretion system PorP/SprF family membrane protein|nr:type IX secretion system membrane protein PorP/SprF [Flavobacteriaceae bacterium]